MKVLLPEGTKLERFEYQLQKTLEQADLAGYALMGFAFRGVKSGELHEIDALVLMESGVFVCLEAKGYGGTWTGNANTIWMSDKIEIRSVNGNPYQQVNRYSWIISDRLRQEIFNEIRFHVNSFVVAPDSATIKIQDAVVNAFQPGRAVRICHCRKLEQILSSIYSTRASRERVAELGLKQIISTLTGIPVEQVDKLLTRVTSPQPTAAVLPVSLLEGQKVSEQQRVKKILWAGVFFIAVATIAIAAAQHFWGNRPCELSTETRINHICYKDLAKTPLRIGILSSPDQYASFKSYLKQQLGSKALDVIIEGNSDISYAEAQDKIANQEWDIVFALSPMNGIKAKDNGYTWLARMFPQLPLTYQAALYVKSNSPIQSVNDIKSNTKIALGDFNSASSFYMPAYDLYGKSITVTTGHRGNKIKDLVASGIVDVGAGVYSTVKDNPQFRVIQVSREIPGSGVYLSPKLAPSSQEQIRQILMNAPKAIQQAANYGPGQEPHYAVFRAISRRADEVMGCADFDRQPVQFFCKVEPKL